MKTLEDIKKEFPIGSLVRALYQVNTALPGSTAVVSGYDQLYGKLFLSLNWIRDGLSGRQCDGAYYSDYFELVSLPETLPKIGQSICPRCGNEMEKKQSESYGLIDKCPGCGYC